MMEKVFLPFSSNNQPKHIRHILWTCINQNVMHCRLAIVEQRKNQQYHKCSMVHIQERDRVKKKGVCYLLDLTPKRTHTKKNVANGFESCLNMIRNTISRPIEHPKCMNRTDHIDTQCAKILIKNLKQLISLVY